MSKFNPNQPAYHIGQKRVTRRKYNAHHYGEEIADIAEKGPYWIGLDEGLSVFAETKWSGTLNDQPWPDALEAIFPLTRDDDPMMPWSVGEWTPFLSRSKLVQSDNDAASARVAEQYAAIRTEYMNAPARIADVRAIREEAEGALARYRVQVDWHLDKIRRYAAALFIEGIRAHDPALKTRKLSKTKVKKIREVESRLVTYFWQSVLHGGPGHIGDADALARWLHTEDASDELLKFQGEALFAVLVKRDEIITEALPVEYRRLACGNVLWKIAHSQPVGPWGVDDRESLLPSRSTLPAGRDKTRRLFFALYDFLNGKANAEKWTVKGEGWKSKANVLNAFIQDNKNRGKVRTIERAMDRLIKDSEDEKLIVLAMSLLSEENNDVTNNAEAFVTIILGIGDRYRSYWD